MTNESFILNRGGVVMTYSTTVYVASTGHADSRTNAHHGVLIIIVFAHTKQQRLVIVRRTMQFKKLALAACK